MPEIIDNGEVLDLIVVDKPNGSQRWPDTLIIYNRIGLGLEYKSGKKDLIVWNCGLPKHGGLYIFNCYSKSKTTFFLGDHIINNKELNFLKRKINQGKKLNEKVSNSKWSYYNRNMFNSSRSYFEDPKNKSDIKNFKNEVLKDKEHLMQLNNNGHKGTIRKLENRIEKNLKKISNLDRKYKKELRRRKYTEEKTKQFIIDLEWNSNQKTQFFD